MILTIREGNGPLDLFLAGYVPENGTQQDVAATGYTLSASPFPGQTALDDAQLVSSGFTGGSRLSNSDNVLLYNPVSGAFDIRIWYYAAGNLWLNADASPVSRQLGPGEAFLILRRNRASAFNWSQPVPYPIPVPGP